MTPWLTGTTLNVQSLLGAIVAIGVAAANAILLVTFGEQTRRRDRSLIETAIGAAKARSWRSRPRSGRS